MSNRNVILYSKIPLMLYLENLKKKIYQQNTFAYQLWIEKSSKLYFMREYYGTVTGTTFKLVKVVYVKNFFTPIVSGEIKDAAKHTKVELHIKSSPYVKLVYACLFVFWCINLILFSTTHEIVCILAISVDIFIFLVFFVLNNHYINHFMHIIDLDFDLK